MPTRKPTKSAHRRHQLRAWATEMRRTPTATEELLWRELRGGQLGATFRRQVVLGEYIVDFYASSLRLVIEVDGGCHEQRAHLDARRDERLRRAGYRVVRVKAEEVVMSVNRQAARVSRWILA